MASGEYSARYVSDQNVMSAPDARQAAHKVARLGMLLALATALHAFEAQLPALPIPGAKVGLANIVSLLTLYIFGLREALLVVGMRQIVGSLFLGTFLSPAFFFGLAGGILSVLAMATMRKAVRGASPVTLSLVGAATHNVGQLLVAWWLIQQPAVLLYLPYLLWFAVPTGAFIGRLMERLLPYLRSTRLWHEEVAFKRTGFTWVEIITALVLVAGGAGMLLFAFNSTPTVIAGDMEAVIRIDGDEIMRLDLAEDRREYLEMNNGEMWLEIRDGTVRIGESTCPQKVCIRRGAIAHPGESIVCVPYHMIITIEGASVDQMPPVDGIT